MVSWNDLFLNFAFFSGTGVRCSFEENSFTRLQVNVVYWHTRTRGLKDFMILSKQIDSQMNECVC